MILKFLVIIDGCLIWDYLDNDFIVFFYFVLKDCYCIYLIKLFIVELMNVYDI